MLDWRQWESARRAALRRDGYRCRSCGKAGRLEVDHIRPLDKGGLPYEPGNLQAICRRCHVEKTSREFPASPERMAWRNYIKRLAQV